MEEPSLSPGVMKLEKLVQWKTWKRGDKLPSKKDSPQLKICKTISKGRNCPWSARIKLRMNARTITKIRTRPVWCTILVRQLLFILSFYLLLSTKCRLINNYTHRREWERTVPPAICLSRCLASTRGCRRKASQGTHGRNPLQTGFKTGTPSPAFYGPSTVSAANSDIYCCV